MVSDANFSVPGIIQQVLLFLPQHLDNFLKVTARGSSLSVFALCLNLFSKHCRTQVMELTLACSDALPCEVIVLFLLMIWGKQGHGTAGIIELIVSDPGSSVCFTVYFP